MKTFLFSLLILLSSCGYHIVTPAGENTSNGKIFIDKIENRTYYQDFSFILEKEMKTMSLRHFTGMARNKGQSFCTVRIILSEDKSRTFQSGSDGRATAVSKEITVTAKIKKNGTETKHSKTFTILERYAVQSELYINDTSHSLKDVSEKIALQVAAWITKK